MCVGGVHSDGRNNGNGGGSVGGGGGIKHHTRNVRGEENIDGKKEGKKR